MICAYTIIVAGIALLIGLVTLCILFKVERSLEEYKTTADHLKKFSKNMEALFAVEKERRKG